MPDRRLPPPRPVFAGGRLLVAALAVAAVAAGACGDAASPPEAEPNSDAASLPDATPPGDTAVWPDGTAPDGTAPDGTAPDALTPPSDSPGRVVWRRLNRTELGNTWRDLIGTSLGLEADLPADDTGYGFDNIASVLTLSPLHLELLERATELLAAEATRRPLTAPLTFAFEAEVMEMTAQWGGPQGEFLIIASSGDVLVPVDLPRAGTWTLSVRAFEQAAGPDHARFAVTADQRVLGSFDAVTGQDDPRVYTLEAELPAGATTLAVTYLNDYYDPPGDRNLGVDWIRVTGPAELDDPDAMPFSRIVLCSDTELDAADRGCAERTLTAFAERAWRRPDLDDAEARLLALFDTARAGGASFLEAVALGLQAAMLAPQAIFRTEFIPAPDAADAAPLDPYALASRLSYFLWSTMPDDALFAAAANGDLGTDAGLRAQISRMLADPRAEALTRNFAGQWLHIRDIDNIFPDPWAFPEFDEALREAMREELHAFFRTFVGGERDMLELLTATDTRLDRRLAEHYGLEAQAPSGATDGDVFAASLDGTGRKGILGKAGLMAALSTPFRTSLVRRGKWVLSQLLCTAPRPPPPGVEGLIETTPEGEGPMTLREKMELHKTEPSCISCHQAMDPIGFALENFDGIGAWRDMEDGLPIDNRGELSGGRVFHGPGELADILAVDPRLPACMAEKMFIYALGRGVRAEDTPHLDAITAAFEASGRRMEALVAAIATSPAFRLQSGQAPDAPSPEEPSR